MCLTFSSVEFQKERKEIGTGKKNIEEMIIEIIPNLRQKFIDLRSLAKPKQDKHKEK